MKYLQQSIASLNAIFYVKAPLQLPANWRVWLANYAWVFAIYNLLAGILALVRLAPLAQTANSTSAESAFLDDAFIAVSVLLLVLTFVVLSGVAALKLRRLKKLGWKFLYGSILVYAVTELLIVLTRDSFVSAISSFIVTSIAIVMLLYVLFQIRAFFKD